MTQSSQEPDPVHAREAALTSLSSWTLADGEDLSQVFLFFRQTFLEALQLTQAFTPLVFHGAHMLDKVQLGLGGVVTEDTVIIAAFTLNPALVMLKVL